MNIAPNQQPDKAGEVSVRWVSGGMPGADRVQVTCRHHADDDHPERTFLGIMWGVAITLVTVSVFYILAAAVCAIAPNHW